MVKLTNGQFWVREALGSGGFATSGAELKSYLNSITVKPLGKVFTGKIYRSLSKNTVENYGALPNQISDFSIENAWGRYNLQGEGALYCSETLNGNKTEIMFYADKNGQQWKDYFTYEFNNVHVENMLDLMDKTVLQKLAITDADLKRIKELVDINDEKLANYEFTNVLGTWARDRYNGIIVPGTRGTQDYRNVIFFKQNIIDNALGIIIPSPIIK